MAYKIFVKTCKDDVFLLRRCDYYKVWKICIIVLVLNFSVHVYAAEASKSPSEQLQKRSTGQDESCNVSGAWQFEGFLPFIYRLVQIGTEIVGKQEENEYCAMSDIVGEKNGNKVTLVRTRPEADVCCSRVTLTYETNEACDRMEGIHFIQSGETCDNEGIPTTIKRIL